MSKTFLANRTKAFTFILNTTTLAKKRNVQSNCNTKRTKFVGRPIRFAWKSHRKPVSKQAKVILSKTTVIILFSKNPPRFLTTTLLFSALETQLWNRFSDFSIDYKLRCYLVQKRRVKRFLRVLLCDKTKSTTGLPTLWLRQVEAYLMLRSMNCFAWVLAQIFVLFYPFVALSFGASILCSVFMGCVSAYFRSLKFSSRNNFIFSFILLVLCNMLWPKALTGLLLASTSMYLFYTFFPVLFFKQMLKTARQFRPWFRRPVPPVTALGAEQAGHSVYRGYWDSSTIFIFLTTEILEKIYNSEGYKNWGNEKAGVLKEKDVFTLKSYKKIVKSSPVPSSGFVERFKTKPKIISLHPAPVPQYNTTQSWNLLKRNTWKNILGFNNPHAYKQVWVETNPRHSYVHSRIGSTQFQPMPPLHLQLIEENHEIPDLHNDDGSLVCIDEPDSAAPWICFVLCLIVIAIKLYNFFSFIVLKVKSRRKNVYRGSFLLSEESVQRIKESISAATSVCSPSVLIVIAIIISASCIKLFYMKGGSSLALPDVSTVEVGVSLAPDMLSPIQEAQLKLDGLHVSAELISNLLLVQRKAYFICAPLTFVLLSFVIILCFAIRPLFWRQLSMLFRLNAFLACTLLFGDWTPRNRLRVFESDSQLENLRRETELVEAFLADQTWRTLRLEKVSSILFSLNEKLVLLIVIFFAVASVSLFLRVKNHLFKTKILLSSSSVLTLPAVAENNCKALMVLPVNKSKH